MSAEDVAPEATVVAVTDVELLSVFLSGFASGIGTTLAQGGFCQEHTSAVVRGVAARFQQQLDTDPAVREQVLADIHYLLRTGEAPTAHGRRLKLGGPA